MSSFTIPRSDRIMVGARYIELGWPVFVLGHKKTPVKNCPRCDRQGDRYVPHDEERCECLTCHGFYSATLDVQRFIEMLDRRPDGMTAVRTGGLSRLLVIDAEATADPNTDDELTGLDVLDDWLGWTGHELPKTLRQRTGGGGIHVVYQLPSGFALRGSPRILPQVDIKADGGYIVVADGMEPHRHWMNPVDDLVEAPQVLLDWIMERKGRIGSRRGVWGGGGGLLADEPYTLALRQGARAGEREPFFARLSFELRRKGTPEDEVVQTMYHHWERCEQPPGDYFHWQYVEYKIIRDRFIEPDKPRGVSSGLRDWARAASAGEQRSEQMDASSGRTYRKVGRVTLARRSK